MFTCNATNNTHCVLPYQRSPGTIGDRVLMSLAALDMISPRPAPAGDKNPKSAKERHPGVVYAPIGLDAVVGDHKPIALSFPLC